jgi:hypothetical protein
VACLNIVIKRLSEGETNLALDFTESAAEIMFKRTHDSILISSNYAPGQAIVSSPKSQNVVFNPWADFSK